MNELPVQNAVASFRVHGTPQQRGSKKPFIVKGHAALADDNPKSKGWMNAVASAAGEAWDGRDLLAGAVELSVIFDFKRPQGHYVNNKRSRPLKATAPYYHTGTPDMDKLMRSVGDALTGVIYADDKQVARYRVIEKRYTESSEGATITVYEAD